MSRTIELGAAYLGDDRCTFAVWAPYAESVEVRLHGDSERYVPLEKQENGYYSASVDRVPVGTLYTYRLNRNKERPDPASRFQPRGVHGPSQVTNPNFPWTADNWNGPPLRDYVTYELHVGTFTTEGTFDAAVKYLDDLVDLGITAVELMPVNQCPGERNWGYDGVYLYAVQNSYGGPDGLKRFTDAAHQRGLAVVLDVVYNHLGPEGNYLWDYGPYFTERYRTPWGEAINYDGPYSEEVRKFVIDNAVRWLTEFRIDALRVDAIHGICDFSARHVLDDLGQAVRRCSARLNRRAYVIPESDLNDSRYIRSRDLGGYGLDAQWNDDFHHAVHTLLTGENDGYYQDFGSVHHLVKALREGYVYSGQWSEYRKRRHGNSSRDLPAEKFVVFCQNHDQVGNRLHSERLSQLAPFETLKIAAAVTILGPYLPMLFMGEEYGEIAPFPYFIDHGDPDLIEAVRQGRKNEFQSFKWEGEPMDPADEATFHAAKLDRSLMEQPKHRALWEYYRYLLGLRKRLNRVLGMSKERTEVVGWESPRVVMWTRRHGDYQAAAVFYFDGDPLDFTIPLSHGSWTTVVDSAAEQWAGPGSSIPETVNADGRLTFRLQPHSCALFTLNMG